MKFTPVTTRKIACGMLCVFAVALFITGKLVFDYYALYRLGIILMVISICLGAGTFQCAVLVSCIDDFRSKFLPASGKPRKKKRWQLSYRGKLILCFTTGVFYLTFGVLYFLVLRQWGNSLLNLIVGMGFLIAGIQFVLLHSGINEIASLISPKEDNGLEHPIK